MLLMLTGLALADLAPPPEIITQVQKPCTIAEQCDATQEGTTCTESTSDPFACSKLKDDGYERMCSGETDAEGRWEAVFCRTRTEHTAPTDEPSAEPAADEPADASGDVIPPSPRRCSTVAGGGAMVSLAAMLAAGWRRRDD